MSSFTDHYQVLGLSPQAEDVVIVAAYRALASRYHPDKFTGPDATIAHRRMAQINAAYAVLSDPALMAAAKADHKARLGKEGYTSPLPPEVKPPLTMSLG